MKLRTQLFTPYVTTNMQRHRRISQPNAASKLLLTFLLSSALSSPVHCNPEATSTTANRDFNSRNSEILDQIITTVNDRVILQSELQKRFNEVLQSLPAAQQLPPKEVLVKQVLDRMILEAIQMQMAEQAGIRVNDNELNEAVLTLADRNDLTFDQFKDELSKQGIAYIDFRDQVRRDMILQQVQKRQVGSRIQVTDQDANSFLNSPLGKERLGADYKIQHILIEIEDSQDLRQVSKAKKEAERVYQQLLKDPNQFSTLAVEHSDSATALEGGDLGWRPAKELPTLFADQVTTMSVGEISKPIKSSNGYHLIRLQDRRGKVDQKVRQLKVRHILIKPNEIRSRIAAKQMIDEIFSKLKAGNTFDQLAQTYSDDPGSARNGGDLGWVSPGQMVPQFEEVMNETGLKSVSEPFESPFGWHILEVTDERTEDFSDEFRTSQAKNFVFKRKFEEELPIWLREIRQEAFVEQKLSIQELARHFISQHHQSKPGNTDHPTNHLEAEQ